MRGLLLAGAAVMALAAISAVPTLALAQPAAAKADAKAAEASADAAKTSALLSAATLAL